MARFLYWYYVEAPYAIILGYLAYARAFAEIFPFGFLLRTLFSPWKNILDRRPIHGLDISRFLEKWTLEFLARAVGALIRVNTIAIGMAVELLVLLLAILCLTFWLLFPVLCIISVSFSVQSL